MAQITPQQAGGVNVVAFLDMLAWSEGTSTSPATKDRGYDVIVTGADRVPEVFTDYSVHPFSRGRKTAETADKQQATGDKVTLIAQLEAAEIPFDKRWGAEKLAAALAEGKKD